MRPTLLLLAALITTTAQAQWDIQQANTTASLRGIHALGNGVAWASGTNGTVLHTTDDGTHWLACSTPPNAEALDFRGIQAFDAQTAIVMSSGKGDLSRLYKTADACKTWKLVFTNPDKEGFWDAIRFDFRPAMNPTPEYGAGVLIGDQVKGQFVIYTTRDKGDVWNVWAPTYPLHAINEYRVAKAEKNETLFAASNSAAISLGVNGPFAFVTGGEGGSRLFIPQPHSPLDNGTTWKFKTLRLPFKSNESSGAFSITQRWEHEFWPDLMIVGGDYKKPNEEGAAVYLSTRGFFQKILKSEHPPHGYRSSVAYAPAQKLWITVGPNGTDISIDDGRNWRALKPLSTQPADADQNWNALSLPFVVGPKGRIGRLNPAALPVPPNAAKTLSSPKTR